MQRLSAIDRECENAIEAFENEGGALAVGTCSTATPLLAVLPPGSIYGALLSHQVSEDWAAQELLAWLHHWAGVFIFAFKLQVSKFALSVDWLHRNRFGHFRHGHNGFGLKGEIAINLQYLDREPCKVLGTLLHELLHAEQEEHGKPGKNNYHNAAFRRRAAEFGLIVDVRGVTTYRRASRFVALLEKHGIECSQIEQPQPRTRGNSKLKLWTCDCKTRLRVAITNLKVLCLNCGRVFYPADPLVRQLWELAQRADGNDTSDTEN